MNDGLLCWERQESGACPFLRRYLHLPNRLEWLFREVFGAVRIIPAKDRLFLQEMVPT